ncbi:unnamed protein product [Lupinus luteus]|uniref:Uncharacterized protein n=1 Tax=Lupinus luteus TaxID=3873 RepID=A0AAV1VQI5_LUPLU
MKRYQSLLESTPISQMAIDHSNFDFPITIPTASPNHVLFCAKLITRQSQPLHKPNSSFSTCQIFSKLRSSSGKENRYQKIGGSRNRKHYNGMFGTVKFPLQMELGDMKMRQERREKPLPKIPAMEEDNGGESCWELMRPLKRRGMLVRALVKASLCIPIV